MKSDTGEGWILGDVGETPSTPGDLGAIAKHLKGSQVPPDSLLKMKSADRFTRIYIPTNRDPEIFWAVCAYLSLPFNSHFHIFNIEIFTAGLRNRHYPL